MKIEKMDISKLNPTKYNPRKDLKPGDTEYEKLKRSINEFGYVEPVIWNKKTNNVVGGHQRLKILRDMGISDVDCVVVELSEEKEKALNIALNKINGDWDNDKLALLISDLQGADFDVSLTGFDEGEISSLLADLEDTEGKDDDYDVTKALEEAAFVKPGDLWTIGRHRMLCGDATNPEDVATLMAGKKANLILTDPPYNMAFKSASGLTIKNDKQDNEQFYNFLLSSFKNMAAHAVDGASAYIVNSPKKRKIWQGQERKKKKD